MERLTERLNMASGSTAPAVPQAGQDGPVEGAAELSRAAPFAETTAGEKRLELTEEDAKEMERPSGTKQDSPAASKPATAGDCPCSKPLVTLTSSRFETTDLRSTPAPLDMDCLVCFNKYNVYRVPKVLECQHAFCAICLKLILRREGSAWTITCPLCRKATAVPGGLIRTLQNQEEIMEHLEKLGSNPEGHVSAIGMDRSSWTQSSHDALDREENVPGDNRLAVQRLVLFLLLVVILTILILPFLYSGLIKWVICLMLTLGLLMSMVLCCTPKLYWSCNRDSLTSCHKESHIMAIA